MKRRNAMNAEELRQYINEEKRKYQRLDLLEELIYMSENVDEQTSDDLVNVYQKLRKELSPSIIIGPDSSFFEFYIQGKKFCVATPKQIYYNRKNKEMLKFIEEATWYFVNLYNNIDGQQPFGVKLIPDPRGLIRTTDYLLDFLALLAGTEFVSEY